MSYNFKRHNDMLEQFTIVLAKRNLSKIGAIKYYDLVYSANDNSPDEISFKVYKTLDGQKNKLWNKLCNLSLIWVKELNEYFQIETSINDERNTLKTITATSLCEAELSQLYIYNTEINTESDIERDAYSKPSVLYAKNDTENSILHRLLTDKAPHYTIGHVDDHLCKIQRSFSFDNISIYDAFNEIAQEIQCIFKYDSSTRTINVYDLLSYCKDCNERFDSLDKQCPKCHGDNIRSGYGENTSIVFSKENLVQNFDLSYNTDECKNCFKLKSGDDLLNSAIRSINPNATDYIYIIDEYMNENMSIDLKNKMDSYDYEYKSYENDHEFNFSFDVEKTYNQVIAKYNGDIYANYKYNDDGERVLVNNTFKKAEGIKGFLKLIELYFDSIDLNVYLESKLLPAFDIEKTTAIKELEKINIENIGTVGLQSLSSSTSKNTIESSIKNYLKIFINGNYKIELNTNSYDFIGIDDSGYYYGEWIGTITLNKYGDTSDTATSEAIRLTVNDDYQNYLEQKIKKALLVSDDSKVEGSIYDIMNIPVTDDEIEFAEALRLYSINRLKSFKDAYQAGVDILIEMEQASEAADFYDLLYIPYLNRIKILTKEIDLRSAEITEVMNLIDLIDELKEDVQKKLSLPEYLGTDLWKEFCSFRRESIYENDNYISDGLDNNKLIVMANAFIESAKKELAKSSKNSITISGTIANFLSMREFDFITKKLETGMWVRAKIDDEVYKLRLSNFVIDFSSLENCEITFTDVVTPHKSNVQKTLDSVKSMSSSYSYVKHQVETSNSTNSTVESWIKDGLDLTLTNIISNAFNQSVVYDKNGIIVKSYDDVLQSYSPTQLKLVNSTIAITDDNWKTVKTAIGKFYYIDPLTKEKKMGYGINSEVLIGNLIIGEGLIIKTKKDTFQIGDNGLFINTTQENGEYKNLFTIQKNGVNKMYINSEGNIVANDLYVNNGSFSGIINSNSGLLAGWELDEGSIKSVIQTDNELLTTIIDSKMNKISFLGEYAGSNSEMTFSWEGIHQESGYTTEGGRYEYTSFSLNNEGLHFSGNLNNDTADYTRSGMSWYVGANSAYIDHRSDGTYFLPMCDLLKVLGNFYVTGNVSTGSITNRSSEQLKYDISEVGMFESVKIINESLIYKYGLKEEKNKGISKEHYGFVIERETSDKIVSSDGDGIDLYSVVATNWNVCRYLLQEINKLKEEITILKSE